MRISALVLTTALVALSSAAFAQDAAPAHRYQVRVRALGVIPDEQSTVNIGGHVKASNAVTPEVDFSYFLTPNIAAELIAGTAHHFLSHSSGASLGETWVLPPTLTLQYHFFPDAAFSPYVGAGLNYTWFYGSNATGSFSDLNIKGGFAPAAQVGFDYWINDNWGLNFDVKKLWLNADATLNNGAVRAAVDLDPWLVGAGVSYRF